MRPPLATPSEFSDQPSWMRATTRFAPAAFASTMALLTEATVLEIAIVFFAPEASV